MDDSTYKDSKMKIDRSISNDFRLESLDVLRGIAILSVICVHVVHSFSTNILFIDKLLGLGAHGVQLFFAISGFTMMLTSRNVTNVNVTFATKFYIKRFFRIIPLFFLASLFYLYKYYETYSFTDYLEFYLLLSGIDPNLINNIVPGGWSIINELYFYILFPFFLILTRSNMFYLGFVLITQIIIYPHLQELINLQNFDATEELIVQFKYYNLLNQLPVFIFGMLAYEYCYGDKNKVLIIVGAVLAFAAAHSLYFNATFVLILVDALFASALIVIGIKFYHVKSKLMAKVGSVTFTGYLLHFSIIDILSYISVGFNLHFIVAFFLVSGATIALSIVLKPYTEDIFQNYGHKFAKRL